MRVRELARGGNRRRAGVICRGGTLQVRRLNLNSLSLLAYLHFLSHNEVNLTGSNDDEGFSISLSTVIDELKKDETGKQLA